MLYISSFSMSEKECGVIETHGPIKTLGLIKDIKGTLWDVRAISGDFVSACREQDLHPYYKDTSSGSFGFVYQEWQPYRIVVIK